MAVAIPSALSDTLARAARRVRVLLALRHGATGLFAGGLGSLLFVAVLRSPWGESWPSEWLAAPPAAGLLLGTLWGATRAVPPLDVARLTEQRLDLKERLSTALALAPAGERDPLVARQVRDAEAHAAGGLDLRAAFPLGVPRRVWAGVGRAWALACSGSCDVLVPAVARKSGRSAPRSGAKGSDSSGWPRCWSGTPERRSSRKPGKPPGNWRPSGTR
jgi:hypothetical protein